jgi:SAM-dependent methyltransferase
MAARRIANELNLDIKYLVADGRYLPFRNERFNFVYSYSVIQHFGKEDAQRTLREVSRVLEPGGVAKIQMANKWGIRSIQQQISRRHRQSEVFEVRYWTIEELRSTFLKTIGETEISADCYFGLGWQWSDFRYMAQMYKPALIASELLKRVSSVVAPMRWVADSVFCSAVKSSASGAGSRSVSSP